MHTGLAHSAELGIAAQVLCALQESCAIVSADTSLSEALAAMDEAGLVRSSMLQPLLWSVSFAVADNNLLVCVIQYC